MKDQHNADTIEFVHMIDDLSTAERLELRQFYMQQGIVELPRNLYYNYTTQEWV